MSVLLWDPLSDPKEQERKILIVKRGRGNGNRKGKDGKRDPNVWD